MTEKDNEMFITDIVDYALSRPWKKVLVFLLIFLKKVYVGKPNCLFYFYLVYMEQGSSC